MKLKLLISTVSVIGIMGISVVAYSQTLTKEVSEPVRCRIHTEVATGGAASEYISMGTVSETPVAAKTETKDEEKKAMPKRIARLSSKEEYLLKRIAMAEAEMEDTKGKALVMLVVLNRIDDPEFPDDVESVIFEKKQFSPIENGRWNRVEPDKDCAKALRLIQKGWDESRGATYFEERSSSTWHQDNLHFLFKHGCHMFYVDSEG